MVAILLLFGFASLTSFTPLRAFNERARDDSDLTDEQAANMRFVVKGDLKEEHNLLKSEPALIVANVLKAFADPMEEKIRENKVRVNVEIS